MQNASGSFNYKAIKNKITNEVKQYIVDAGLRGMALANKDLIARDIILHLESLGIQITGQGKFTKETREKLDSAIAASFESVNNRLQNYSLSNIQGLDLSQYFTLDARQAIANFKKASSEYSEAVDKFEEGIIPQIPKDKIKAFQSSFLVLREVAKNEVRKTESTLSPEQFMIQKFPLSGKVVQQTQKNKDEFNNFIIQQKESIKQANQVLAQLFDISDIVGDKQIYEKQVETLLVDLESQFGDTGVARFKSFLMQYGKLTNTEIQKVYADHAASIRAGVLTVQEAMKDAQKVLGDPELVMNQDNDTVQTKKWGKIGELLGAEWGGSIASTINRKSKKEIRDAIEKLISDNKINAADLFEEYSITHVHKWLEPLSSALTESLSLHPSETTPYGEIVSLDATQDIKRNVSDVGLTIDEFNKKLEAENEAIKAGNLAFKERFVLFKKGKVIESFISSSDRQVVVPKEYMPTDADMAMHTHAPLNDNSKKFSPRDISRGLTTLYEAGAKELTLASDNFRLTLDTTQMKDLNAVMDFAQKYEVLWNTVRAYFAKEINGTIDYNTEELTQHGTALLNNLLLEMFNTDGLKITATSIDSNISDIAKQQAKHLYDALTLAYNVAGDDLSTDDMDKLTDAVYRSWVKDAADASQSMVGAAKEATQEAQDSHSPSKIAEMWGGDWGQGCANGILNKREEVAAAIRVLVDEAKIDITDVFDDLPNILSENKYTAIKEGLIDVFGTSLGLKEDGGDSTSKIKDLEAEIKRLQKEYNEISNTAIEYERTIDNLAAALAQNSSDDYREEYVQAAQKVRELRNEIEQLNKTIDEQKGEISSLTDLSKTQEDGIQQKLDELNLIQQQNQALHTKVKALEKIAEAQKMAVATDDAINPVTGEINYVYTPENSVDTPSIEPLADVASENAIDKTKALRDVYAEIVELLDRASGYSAAYSRYLEKLDQYTHKDSKGKYAYKLDAIVNQIQSNSAELQQMIDAAAPQEEITNQWAKLLALRGAHYKQNNNHEMDWKRVEELSGFSQAEWKRQGRNIVSINRELPGQLASKKTAAADIYKEMTAEERSAANIYNWLIQIREDFFNDNPFSDRAVLSFFKELDKLKQSNPEITLQDLVPNDLAEKLTEEQKIIAEFAKEEEKQAKRAAEKEEQQVGRRRQKKTVPLDNIPEPTAAELDELTQKVLGPHPDTAPHTESSVKIDTKYNKKGQQAADSFIEGFTSKKEAIQAAVSETIKSIEVPPLEVGVQLANISSENETEVINSEKQKLTELNEMLVSLSTQIKELPKISIFNFEENDFNSWLVSFSQTLGEAFTFDEYVKRVEAFVEETKSILSKISVSLNGPIEHIDELAEKINNLVADQQPVNYPVSFDIDFDHLNSQLGQVNELLGKISGNVLLNVTGIDGLQSLQMAPQNNQVNKDEVDALSVIVKSIIDHDIRNDQFATWESRLDRAESIWEDLMIENGMGSGDADKFLSAMKAAGFINQDGAINYHVPSSGAQHSMALVGDKYVLLGRDYGQPETFQSASERKRIVDELVDEGINIARTVVLSKMDSHASDSTRDFIEVQQRLPGVNHRSAEGSALAEMPVENLAELFRQVNRIIEKGLTNELAGDNLLFDEDKSRLIPIDLFDKEKYYPRLRVDTVEELRDRLRRVPRFTNMSLSQKDTFDNKLDTAFQLFSDNPEPTYYNEKKNGAGSSFGVIPELVNNWRDQINQKLQAETFDITVNPKIDIESASQDIENLRDTILHALDKPAELLDTAEFISPLTGEVFDVTDEKDLFKQIGIDPEAHFDFTFVEDYKAALREIKFISRDADWNRIVDVQALKEGYDKIQSIISQFPILNTVLPDFTQFDYSKLYPHLNGNLKEFSQDAYDMQNAIIQMEYPKNDSSTEEVKREDNILDELRKQVDSVTDAVDRKTQAFIEEGQIVGGVVTSEVDNLDVLFGTIQNVEDKIAGLQQALNTEITALNQEPIEVNIVPITDTFIEDIEQAISEQSVKIKVAQQPQDSQKGTSNHAIDGAQRSDMSAKENSFKTQTFVGAGAAMSEGDKQLIADAISEHTKTLLEQIEGDVFEVVNFVDSQDNLLKRQIKEQRDLDDGTSFVTTHTIKASLVQQDGGNEAVPYDSYIEQKRTPINEQQKALTYSENYNTAISESNRLLEEEAARERAVAQAKQEGAKQAAEQEKRDKAWYAMEEKRAQQQAQQQAENDAMLHEAYAMNHDYDDALTYSENYNTAISESNRLLEEEAARERAVAQAKQEGAKQAAEQEKRDKAWYAMEEKRAQTDKKWANHVNKQERDETFQKLINGYREIEKLRNGMIHQGSAEQKLSKQEIQNLEEQIRLETEKLDVQKLTPKQRRRIAEAQDRYMVNRSATHSAKKQLDNRDKELASAIKKLQAADASKYQKDVARKIVALQKSYNAPDATIHFETVDEYIKKIQEINNLLSAQNKIGNSTKLTKIQGQIADVLTKNTRMPKGLRADFQALNQEIQEIITSENYDAKKVTELNNRYLQLENTLKTSGRTGLSFADTLKKGIKDISMHFAATLLSFQDWIRYARTAFTTVKELDSALTELKVVSNASNVSLQNISESSYQLAQSLGTTTNEVIKSITEWRRLGNTIEESMKLAAQAATLSTGGFMDTSTATNALTSTLQAFDMSSEELGSVVDQYIYIGNNFAINSEELATSLTKSVAALKLAGNSLAEIEALETAGTSIMRDADAVSQALKVVSMRLRGTSAEDLTEIGEETDFLIEDASKLEAKIKSLTKTQSNPEGISIIDQTTQAYRSTYDILLDISKVYDELDDANKASLLESIAGKTRGAAVAAILQSGDILEQVVSEVEEYSAGAGERAIETSMTSIEKKVTVLTNKLKKAGTDLFNADMSKEAIDAATKFLDVLEDIVKILNPIVTAVGKIASTILSIPHVGTAGLAGFGLFKGVKSLQSALSSFANFGNALSQDVGQWSNSTEAIIEYQRVIKGLSTEEAVFILRHQGLSEAQIRTTLTTQTEALAHDEYSVSAVNAALANRHLSNSNVVLATSEGAATTSTSLLSAALTKLKIAIMTNPVGAIIAAATVVIGAFALIKSKIDETNQAIRDNADALVESASSMKQTTKNMDAVIQKYNAYIEKLKETNLTEDEQYDIRSNLYSLQEDIIGQYAIQANGIDLVNGKYETQLDILKEINDEERVQWLRDNKSNYDDAKQMLEKRETFSFTSSYAQTNDVEMSPELQDQLRGIFTDYGPAYSEYIPDLIEDALYTEFAPGAPVNYAKVINNAVAGQLYNATAEERYDFLVAYIDKLTELSKNATNRDDFNIIDDIISQLAAQLNSDDLKKVPEYRQAIEEYNKNEALVSEFAETYIEYQKNVSEMITKMANGGVSDDQYQEFLDNNQHNNQFVNSYVQGAFDAVTKQLTDAYDKYGADMRIVSSIRAEMIADSVSSVEFDGTNDIKKKLDALVQKLGLSTVEAYKDFYKQWELYGKDIDALAQHYAEKDKSVLSLYEWWNKKTDLISNAKGDDHYTNSGLFDAWESVMNSFQEQITNRREGKIEVSLDDILKITDKSDKDSMLRLIGMDSFQSYFENAGQDLDVAIKQYMTDLRAKVEGQFAELSESDKGIIQGMMDDIFNVTIGGDNNWQKVLNSYRELKKILDQVRDNKVFSESEIASIQEAYGDLSDAITETTGGFKLQESAVVSLVNEYIKLGNEGVASQLVIASADLESTRAQLESAKALLEAKRAIFNINSANAAILVKTPEYKEYTGLVNQVLAAQKAFDDAQKVVTELEELLKELMKAPETESYKDDNRIDWWESRISKLSDDISDIETKYNNVSGYDKEIAKINELIEVNENLNTARKQALVDYQSDFDEYVEKNNLDTNLIQGLVDGSIQQFDPSDEMYEIYQKAQEKWNKIVTTQNDIDSTDHTLQGYGVQKLEAAASKYSKQQDTANIYKELAGNDKDRKKWLAEAKANAYAEYMSSLNAAIAKGDKEEQDNLAAKWKQQERQFASDAYQIEIDSLETKKSMKETEIENANLSERAKLYDNLAPYIQKIYDKKIAIAKLSGDELEVARLEQERTQAIANNAKAAVEASTEYYNLLKSTADINKELATNLEDRKKYINEAADDEVKSLKRQIAAEKDADKRKQLQAQLAQTERNRTNDLNQVEIDHYNTLKSTSDIMATLTGDYETRIGYINASYRAEKTALQLQLDLLTALGDEVEAANVRAQLLQLEENHRKTLFDEQIQQLELEKERVELEGGLSDSITRQMSTLRETLKIDKEIAQQKIADLERQGKLNEAANEQLKIKKEEYDTEKKLKELKYQTLTQKTDYYKSKAQANLYDDTDVEASYSRYKLALTEEYRTKIRDTIAEAHQLQLEGNALEYQEKMAEKNQLELERDTKLKEYADAYQAYKDSISEYNHTVLTNAIKDIQNKIEHAPAATADDYVEMMEYNSANQARYIVELDEAYSKLQRIQSTLGENSSQYREQAQVVQNIKDRITECENNTIEWKKTLLALPLTSISRALERISYLSKEINDERERYDEVISGATAIFDQEIEANEKIKETLQDQLDALTKANDERTKSLNLQKAQWELEKAREQKTVKVYREKEGWVYESAQEELRNAQEQYDNAKFEWDTYQIQKQIDEIDETNEALNKVKETWSEISQKATDALNIEKFYAYYAYATKESLLSGDLSSSFLAEEYMRLAKQQDIYSIMEKRISAIQSDYEEMQKQFEEGSITYEDLQDKMTIYVRELNDAMIGDAQVDDYVFKVIRSICDTADNYQASLRDNTQANEVFLNSVDALVKSGVSAGKTAEEIIADVKSYYTSLPSTISITNEEVERLVGDSLTRIKTTLESSISDIKDILEEFKEYIQKDVLDTLDDKTNAKFDEVIENVRDKLKSIREAFSGHADNLFTIFDAISHNASRSAINIYNAFHRQFEILSAEAQRLNSLISSNLTVQTLSTVADAAKSITSTTKTTSQQGQAIVVMVNNDNGKLDVSQAGKHHDGLAGGLVGGNGNQDAKLKLLGLRKLESNEIPAVLQRGEAVLTRKQQGNMLQNLNAAYMAGMKELISIPTSTVTQATNVNVTFPGEMVFNQVQDIDKYFEEMANKVKGVFAQQFAK